MIRQTMRPVYAFFKSVLQEQMTWLSHSILKLLHLQKIAATMQHPTLCARQKELLPAPVVALSPPVDSQISLTKRTCRRTGCDQGQISQDVAFPARHVCKTWSSTSLAVVWVRACIG